MVAAMESATNTLLREAFKFIYILCDHCNTNRLIMFEFAIACSNYSLVPLSSKLYPSGYHIGNEDIRYPAKPGDNKIGNGKVMKQHRQ